MRRDRAATCTTATRLAVSATNRSPHPLAHDVLESDMLLALLLGVPLVLIAVYAVWMAGELGLGPSWRRRAAPRPASEAIREADDPEVSDRRSRVG